MKGRYNKDSRRVFTDSGYKITIGVIIAVAIALVMLLLVFLPIYDDTIKEGKTIVSIVSNSDEIGVGNDPSKIFVKVYYSDGSHDEVMLTDMVYEGLNISVPGTQNVSLNYGGFEQTITIKVKEVDCILRYQASVGGRIQGETEQGIANGSDAATVIAIPETGYTFVEWNDGYPYPTRKDTAVNTNATYIAAFEKAKYTVRFYYLNGTVAVEEQVSYGEAPAKVPSPEDDPNMQIYGYTFSNWIPTDFSSIDRDMVIRPEYVKTATDVEVTIPNDIYGNSMGITDLNEYGFYAYGENATITATPFNSRKFAYWLIEGSDGVYRKLDCEDSGSFTVGSLYSNVNFISTKFGTNQYILSFIASENINKVRIKAIFAYEESTISFINNQSKDGNFSCLLYYGNPIGLMIKDADFFTEDKGPGNVIGLKFLGWFTEGTDIRVTAESTFEQPTKIIAKWEKRVFTVRFLFEAEGSEVYDKKIYVKYNNTLASGTKDELGTNICGIPSEIPQKEHFIFIGWQNSITYETIDDKTKVTVHSNYLDENGNATGDFANRIIVMTPIFQPIKHKLTVKVKGAGTVSMEIKEGSAQSSPVTVIEQINGILEIREDYQYAITFEALEGYALKKVLWTDLEGSDTFNYTNNESNVTMSLNVLCDNDIIVEFGNKKFDIKIIIDESVGSITYLDALISGTGTQININVDYNASINLLVGTINKEYVIENIIIDSVYLTYENGEYKGGDEPEYNLNLEKIKSDITIEINYKSNNHTIVTPTLADGNIKLTSIYNPDVTTEISDNTNEYVHGSENVYRITANAGGKYIKSIKINGYAYDLYNSGNSDILYHNWYINNVSAEITVVEINNEYYYCYGEFVLDGNTYIYCQTAEGSSSNETTAVFSVSVSGGSNYYTKIIDTAIINYGKDKLNISTRDIYSTSISKDNRITAIDLLLKVVKNYVIEVVFSDMVYSVNVESNSNGKITITQTTVSYNGNSIVTSTPEPGYYIEGYIINNGEKVTITRTSNNASYSIKFDNENSIKEDKNIRFIYGKINITVNFLNNTASYRVYVDSDYLNSSIDKSLPYKESAVYRIFVDEGNYCINSIKIIYVESKQIHYKQIHYNMTEYFLSVENITESLSVEITCGIKSDNVSTAPSVYSIDKNTANTPNVTWSAEYFICDINVNNGIIVLADTGYQISTISLTGDKGHSYTENYSNVLTVQLLIPAGTFENDENVSVMIVSSRRQFQINTMVIGSEDLDFVKTQEYGSYINIDIKEVENHYISAFRIDGEDIRFDSNNWLSRARNSLTKEYISGTYLLYITKDIDIYLEYSLNVYKVVLDNNSINGITNLSSYNPANNEVKANIKTIQHGESLIISMTSDTGYHIKNLYLNNILVEDLALPSNIPNNNTGKSYTYLNVISNITVKVDYEINRYGFTYRIENISQNFANYDNSPGTLTTESSILQEGDKYKGIEYGRNFYINAIPSLLNGYYLVSIYIEYKGVKLTIPAGENKLISSKGGMIYFNTMLDFNEGITQDIDLIKLTFNKHTYDINLYQESAENTGVLKLSYTHPNSGSNPVALFDGEGNLYYYLPENKNIYIKEGNVYILSDLQLRYVSAENRYYYVDGEGNNVILKAEHGIRYTVESSPALGYQRISFVLNGNEINSSVNNNLYSINIIRNTNITVKFVILTFTINFNIVVADKNLTGRMSDSMVSSYADISIEDITNPYAPEIYKLGINTSLIQRVFTYGTKIRFIMTPKFQDTGYYLYNMYYKEREINSFEGFDVTSMVAYGGENGITVNSDINVIANFRIIRYTVTTNIQYSETITGESANTLINESNATIAWGDSATIKVASGSGYRLKEIYVKRGGGTPIFVTLTPTQEQLINDLEKFIANDYSPTNGTRDIIIVEKIKTNIVVNAKFERKSYSMMINFTNVNFLESISANLNKYNPIYNSLYPEAAPVSGIWSGNTYIIPTRYYDELAAVITPKNGYKIQESELVIRAVVWNEATNSFVALKDNGGKDIIYYLDFDILSNGAISFSFHKPTAVIADLNVQSDLIINLTLNIKRYTVKTSINRESSSDDAPNTTSIVMSVKTKAGQNIWVNNIQQPSQTFTPTNSGKIYIAEHHGYIEYVFDAPEGYMLGSLYVNDIIWAENILKTTSYTDKYIKVVASKNQGSNTYHYIVTFYVNDDLIKGGPNFIVYDEMSNINIEISVKLINYKIKTRINDVEYQSHMIDNKNTFTDNKTIAVVTANSINHYSYLNIAPAISEGYKVTAMNISAMNAGALTNIGYSFNISQSNTIHIINTYLKYVDVLSDNLVLYICYSTEIKKYNVEIFSYAYSIDMWPDNTEGIAPYNCQAGCLNVSALTNGVTTDNITTYYNHEYFTVITSVAYAKTDYVLYTIQEYTGSKAGDWLTLDDNWTEVKDGIRGINYSIVTKPSGQVEHTFEYIVDSYGDRVFRVVFRQQTTVTVNVINPYRFYDTISGNAAVGNMNYIYYPEIVATVSNVRLHNHYNVGTDKVVDKYIYKVNVGSVIKLAFFDNGKQATSTFGIYYKAGNDEYVQNTEITTNGFEIRAKWDFYLKATTKLYITYQKETFGASSIASGGLLNFGLDGGDVTVESDRHPLYSQATVLQKVDIVVVPNENYIFTGLKVRQINQSASRKNGKIIYATGAGEWLTYDKNNFSSLDTNGFIINESLTVTGNVCYTITMTGNMELSFVFYKTYNISYTSRYSDAGDINNITLQNNTIYDNLCDNNSIVSYNSYFTLTAPLPEQGKYQFVGWYVNNVNVYKYLSTRYPDNNRLINRFEINSGNMSLLLNNVELDNIVIIALYQRIINVSIINELYYYDTDTAHWNSWTTGGIRSQFYDYVHTQGLSVVPTIENVNNRTSSLISTVTGEENSTYNSIKSIIGNSPSSTDKAWNTLDSIPEMFDRNTLKVYSSANFFKVLYQNITNENYIDYTWKNGSIELMMVGVPNTVRLQAWQYYNWVSGAYEDIGYSYADPSGLTDNLGNDIIIDSTNMEYIFSLEYIFSGEMSGAISDSSGNARPLIIRPFMRKVVSIELSKLAYLDYLGGTSESGFSSIVAPSIDRNNVVFVTTNNFYGTGEPFEYTSDDSSYGEYDYGAKLKIRSYCNIITETGMPRYIDNVGNKYRFLGWFFNWSVNNVANFRYILDMEDETNLAGEEYNIYLTYNFGEEPPENDTVQYRAVYICQYEQNLYSYNIAGGFTYANAVNNGQFSYKDAPSLDYNSLLITTGNVTFSAFDTRKIGNARAVYTNIPYGYDMLSSALDTHKMQFYIDIGCQYTFSLNFLKVGYVANYVSNNASTQWAGYDPDYDRQYSIIFSNDAAKTDTYANALKSPSKYVFGGANESNLIDSSITVSGDLQIDIQYATEVKLIFKNIMWYSGITLPLSLSQELTYGKNNPTSALTVWDYYTSEDNGFGDSNITAADGTVVINFILDTTRYTNFWGDFKYTPYGYKDGQGITPLKRLVYYLDNNNNKYDSFRATNNQTLFNPNVSEYRRHIEINYNQSFDPYIEGGTLLFGDKNYGGAGGIFSIENTGNGTNAKPYKIYTAQQLKNINLFWYYNDFSCINTSGNQTHFKLYQDINLQGLDQNSSSAPYMLANSMATKAWVPLCYQYIAGVIYGFDGVLDGSEKTLYGLAVKGIAGGNLVNPDSPETLIHEKYDYTYGYGIFGMVKNGKIKDINIGNAFIDLPSLLSAGYDSSATCANIGVLAAGMINAEINNVTFKERYAIGRYNKDGVIYRIYINSKTSGTNVGSLAGFMSNCIVKTITMDVYETLSASADIFLTGAKAGSLFGSIVDNESEPTATNIDTLILKSTNSGKLCINNIVVAPNISGGIIGYMNAQNALVKNIKFNFANKNIILKIGMDGSKYVGGIIGYLEAGTLKDTIMVSNSASVYEVKESDITPLSNENSAVGGIVGYNCGIITNLTQTYNPGSIIPYTYSYTPQGGISGDFYLYGGQAGGVAGRNSGEISGFKLHTSTYGLVTIYAIITKNGQYVLSGSKGGIAGYNTDEALINDCSFGDSVNGPSVKNYLYVIDQNSSSSMNTSNTSFDYNALLTFVVGDLFIGGIAGATKGAIYNSYVARADIFTKYYNGIAHKNNPFVWNLYVGGIAGGQPFDDDLSVSNEPDSFIANTSNIKNHPNVFTPLQYMMYDWYNNGGVMNDEIMAINLAMRSRIQSCYTYNMRITVGVYIWCDSNDYSGVKANPDDEEGEEDDSEWNAIGSKQNISVGGICGYNNNTAGSSSVSNCYAYGTNFDIKMGAYGDTRYDYQQYKYGVGWFRKDRLLGDKYYINRVGLRITLNVKGITAGIRDAQLEEYNQSSVASYCWTQNCTTPGNIVATGGLNNYTGERSYPGSYPGRRGIDCGESEIAPTKVALIGGIYYNKIYKNLSYNTDRYWGTYGDKVYAGGFIAYDGNPDGRVYRTDPESGMLCVWHSDLSGAGAINYVKWYMNEGAFSSWFAKGGAHYKDSYQDAVADTNFLNSYLVGGQTSV